MATLVVTLQTISFVFYKCKREKRHNTGHTLARTPRNAQVQSIHLSDGLISVQRSFRREMRLEQSATGRARQIFHFMSIYFVKRFNPVNFLANKLVIVI